MAITSYSLIHTNVHKDLDLDDTGEVIASSSATLFSLRVDNSANSGTIVYVKIYNKATAATASDTPIYILRVAAAGKIEFPLNMGVGRKFSTGISIRCVTEAGTGGTSSPASNVTATILTS